MRIAVIFPSRGLAFSQTCEELLNNLEGYDYEIFFSHGVSIPECFIKPLQRALNRPKNPFTHIWFVEDDMILPDSTLDAMLIADVPVATMDYPVSKGGQGSVFESDGKVLFCGTGCLLVKREVFDIIKPPYFRTDIKWNMKNHGDFIRLTAEENTRNDVYGLHDVTFGLKLHKFDIPISVVGIIGQRKLVSLGKAGTNDGAHDIEEWKKVIPNVIIKRVKKYPIVPLGNLMSVMTKNGEIIVHPTHGKKLIKQGIATPIKKLKVGIDYNGFEL